MAAADVDIAYLAQHLSVSDSTLTSVLEVPTAEVVAAVLEAVTKKAREYDDLAAEKIQVEVAFETQVRGAESHSQVLKETADEALLEVQSLRTKLQEEGSYLSPHFIPRLNADLASFAC